MADGRAKSGGKHTERGAKQQRSGSKEAASGIDPSRRRGTQQRDAKHGEYDSNTARRVSAAAEEMQHERAACSSGVADGRYRVVSLVNPACEQAPLRDRCQTPQGPPDTSDCGGNTADRA